MPCGGGGGGGGVDGVFGFDAGVSVSGSREVGVSGTEAHGSDVFVIIVIPALVTPKASATQTYVAKLAV